MGPVHAGLIFLFARHQLSLRPSDRCLMAGAIVGTEQQTLLFPDIFREILRESVAFCVRISFSLTDWNLRTVIYLPCTRFHEVVFHGNCLCHIYRLNIFLLHLSFALFVFSSICFLTDSVNIRPPFCRPQYKCPQAALLCRGLLSFCRLCCRYPCAAFLPVRHCPSC